MLMSSSSSKSVDKVNVLVQNQTIEIYKDDLPNVSCDFETNALNATDVRPGLMFGSHLLLNRLLFFLFFLFVVDRHINCVT